MHIKLTFPINGDITYLRRVAEDFTVSTNGKPDHLIEILRPLKDKFNFNSHETLYAQQLPVNRVHRCYSASNEAVNSSVCYLHAKYIVCHVGLRFASVVPIWFCCVL